MTVRFGSRVDVPLQGTTCLSDAALGTSSAAAVAPAKPHMTPSPSESQRQFQSQFTAFQNLAPDANEWLGSSWRCCPSVIHGCARVTAAPAAAPASQPPRYPGRFRTDESFRATPETSTPPTVDAPNLLFRSHAPAIFDAAMAHRNSPLAVSESRRATLRPTGVIRLSARSRSVRQTPASDDQSIRGEHSGRAPV